MENAAELDPHLRLVKLSIFSFKLLRNDDLIYKICFKTGRRDYGLIE